MGDLEDIGKNPIQKIMYGEKTINFVKELCAGMSQTTKYDLLINTLRQNISITQIKHNYHKFINIC